MCHEVLKEDIPGPFAFFDTSLPSRRITALSYSFTICQRGADLATEHITSQQHHMQGATELTFTLQMREKGKRKMMRRKEKKARM